MESKKSNDNAAGSELPKPTCSQVIGRDCEGKEIIPLNGRKLSLHTNRHTTTDGYLWGWIEGTTRNTVWGDDSKFNYEKAEKLVDDYNSANRAAR